MKKKNPVRSVGYFSKNPTLASLPHQIKQNKTKHPRERKESVLGPETGRIIGSEKRNGPHPEESLPSAGDDEAARLGRRISRFVTGTLEAKGDELSRSIAGRSCLPQMRFPPEPSTAPASLTAAKQVGLSLAGFDRRGMPAETVVAPDSTRDSIVC